MIRAGFALLIALSALSAPAARAEAFDPALEASLEQSVERGLDYFTREQAADGSWTKLIQVSSVMYNTHMIFLYEFLNRLEEKRAIVDGLMSQVWSVQNADGGLPGYTGGASNPSVSVLAYVAGKIAGEDEDSPRMSRLEKFIRGHGGYKKAFMAKPYLMVFGIDKTGGCFGGMTESLLLSLDGGLPWVRVMLYPLLNIFSRGQTHVLGDAKFPKRLGQAGFCPRWLPHPFRHLHLGEKKFWRWMDRNMNDDGTLFDYTPTTVPALMALSLGGPKYAPLLEKGLRTLESFQIAGPAGIYQAPGEASIGETNGVLNSLLELGYGLDDARIRKAEEFLWSMQQPATGAFGFSKHNQHFPDSDDTSNSLYVLKRLSLLRGNGHTDPAVEKRLEKGLDWLVSLQNSDGGFGTWEKNRFLGRVIGRVMRGNGLVLSESVTEHTARIVVNLSLFRQESPRYAKAYDRALEFLLKKQDADGGYPGTWFVDYLFGTSMVLAALGTHADEPRVAAAIEKSLKFILDRQNADGGFSESPDSFEAGRSVALSGHRSSPAQTGLIVSQLLTFVREEGGTRSPALQAAFARAAEFLVRTQGADGLWHDPTWTGVTFPKVEYLIYPYIQEIGAVQAVGMYLREARSGR